MIEEINGPSPCLCISDKGMVWDSLQRVFRVNARSHRECQIFEGFPRIGDWHHFEGCCDATCESVWIRNGEESFIVTAHYVEAMNNEST